MRRGSLLAHAGLLLVACSGDDGGTTGDPSTSSGSATDTTASSTTGTGSDAGTASGATDPGTTSAGSSGGTAGSSGSGSSGSGGSTGGGADPTVLWPKVGLEPAEIGVLVNDQDALSGQIADYYVTARGIPAANVVHLDFPTGNVLSQANFDIAFAEMETLLPATVQALAITWTTPYRVDCMSVTSAFALGFDTVYCNTSGMACGDTAPVAYYDDGDSFAPFDDHGIRPAMMIAAETLDEAKAVIDRGVAADDTFPESEGYLVRTTDTARSVRYPEFQITVAGFDHMGGLSMQYIDNADGSGLNYIENETDVLFYFTGLVNVPAIDTLTYRPGAVADHLTSFGGQVPTSGQMSIIEWTRAGATASYGTVVEPCNYLAKFPNSTIMAANYFRGQSVLEAYWKSVWWPGEGLFIGEPLARPWGSSQSTFQDGTLTLTTTLLEPGVDYDVQSGDTEQGPWTTVFTGSVPYPVRIDIEIADADAPYYRLLRAP